MTRNWIELASRTLRIVEHRRVRPRQRRGWGIRLESLEARLALSSYSAGSLHADLNPQPLPPGVRTFELDTVLHVRKQGGGRQEIDKGTPAINPQPLPPGRKAVPAINPQPLPPGRAVDIVALTARGHENSAMIEKGKL
jgi:hypothetical protein